MKKKAAKQTTRMATQSMTKSAAERRPVVATAGAAVGSIGATAGSTTKASAPTPPAAATVPQLSPRIASLARAVTAAHRNTLTRALEAAKGDWATATRALTGKVPANVLHKVDVAEAVFAAVGDLPAITDAVLTGSGIATLRDLADRNPEKLAALLAPGAVANSAAQQAAKEAAVKINNQVFARQPMAVLQRMGRESQLGVSDTATAFALGEMLQRLPADLDMRRTPFHKVISEAALQQVPDEHRSAVARQAKALWLTMNNTPTDAPHVVPALMKRNLSSAFQISEKPARVFARMLAPDVDAATAGRIHTQAVDRRIGFEHSLVALRESVRGGLAAVQGKKTMEERVNEVGGYLQANDIPLNLDTLFADMDHCECRDCQSVYSPSAYFVELLNFLRNNNLDPQDTHASGADSPDISGTPLEKLFWRRPDLGDLELTCENSNTAIPYVDLVNEVMESFVVNRAKFAASGARQAALEAFNIVDETTEELLAQPQHTNYAAFCVLKNERVFPFTLPFHQPIEEARLILKYLGTSRYEVLDTFRAARAPLTATDRAALPILDNCDHGETLPSAATESDGRLDAEGVARRETAVRQAATTLENLPGRQPQAIDPGDRGRVEQPRQDARRMAALQAIVLDRSAEAEYLGLTQDEYVILTKQAFWPKEYFDLSQGSPYTEDQYRRNIGVRTVGEYYGYADDAQMLDPAGENLAFVKQQFLPRTGLAYAELAELLKTRFINPCYPQGLALEMMRRVASSYRFLQTLVNGESADPETRFAELIAFLSHDRALIALPAVVAGWSRSADHPITVLVEEEVNTVIRDWVYHCFELLGKLIVLESGEAPTLPITGAVYVEGAKTACARLLSDGRILGAHNDVLCGTVSVAMVENESGGFTACAGPVEWTGAQWNDDQYVVKLADGQIIGRISTEGLWVWLPRHEQLVQAEWIAPKDSCDLSGVRLQHLDGTQVTVDECDKLQRFIRLWRKLGWTMPELDTALIAFAPKPVSIGRPDPAGGRRLPGFELIQDSCDRTVEREKGVSRCRCAEVATADITPELLTQLAAVKELLERSGLPVEKLLTFWSAIGTVGEKPLYKRLFLSRNMVGIDDVFLPDANGDFLTGSAKFSGHLPVLMAALNLKATDIAAFLDSAGSRDAPLTLANVSTLYRCGLLTKTLRLKTSDFQDLVDTCGDPFEDAVATLRLFEAWEKMEAAGFTFRQLAYIIKGRDDPARPLAPARWEMLQTAKTLFDGLTAVEEANPDLAILAARNPELKIEDVATADLVRTKASQIFDAGTVEQIAAFLEGTTVHATNAPSGLAIAIPEPAPAWAAKLRYLDPLDDKGLPRGASLQVTGCLSPDDAELVKRLFPGNGEWSEAVDRAGKQARAFFADALAPIFSDPSAGDEANANALTAAQDVLLAGDVSLGRDGGTPATGSTPTSAGKRVCFLGTFLPLLRHRLKERLVDATMATTFGVSPDVSDVLLKEALSAKGTPATPAMNMLAAIPAMRSDAGQAWEGYLFAPADDDYEFVAVAVGDPDKAPPPLQMLEAGGREILFEIQQPDPDNVWSTRPVRLKAGVPYRIGIATGPEGLKWRRTGSPASPIPDSALLPLISPPVEAVFTGFAKAAILVNGFNLSAEEVRYLQANGRDFGHLDFNSVSVAAWRRLAAYAALRDSLPKTETRLIDLFAWAHDGRTGELMDKVQACTLWEKERIRSLVDPSHFDLDRPGAFVSEAGLVPMQRAVAVANKVGVDIDRLFDWARPGSKFWPCQGIAKDIRMAMRGRFEVQDWEKAVKPLNDQLREMQKQALIAFLMTDPDLRKWGVSDADSLFEFFLIDVQMGPERQTSRMVQAISSVQLFIQRCLLGLEESHGVAPGDIDRDRWEWMQKYRVWEANRKVFLYPENWIRPELRDDKSPFYRELESELLQKDASPQATRDAIGNYLHKVDEVANLRIVGLYLEEDAGKLHVFGRTRNAPYQYHYRYYENNPAAKYWHPWEKMQVDIPCYDADHPDGTGATSPRTRGSGTYLVPVVWNKRLLVFFPQFLRKTRSEPAPDRMAIGQDAAGKTQVPVSKTVEYWDIKMAWSEYRSGKWTQKQVSDAGICDLIQPDAASAGAVFPDVSAYLFVPVISPDRVAIEILYTSEPMALATSPEEQPDPLLQEVRLRLDTTGDDKDVDITFDVSVKDGSGTEFAYLPTTGQGIRYDTGSTIDTGLFQITNKSIAKSKCQGFTAVITDQGSNHGWIFNATVTLRFEGDLTLTAQGKDLRLTQPKDAATIRAVDPVASTSVPAPDAELAGVRLHIKTTDDDKDADVRYSFQVKDKNNLLAALYNVGGGILYNNQSEIDVGWIHAQHGKLADGSKWSDVVVEMYSASTSDHRWTFEATAFLLFKDGTTMKRTGKFKDFTKGSRFALN